MKKLLPILLLISTSSLEAQKNDSLLSAVYYWDKLEPMKEESRVRRQVLEGSTFALSYFEIHTSTLEPAKAPHPPHTHADQEELVIIKEGFLKVTIKDSIKILGPGSIAMAMPGEEHGFENGGATPVTYFILKFKSRLPMDIERAKQAGGSFMINWNELATSKTEKGYRRNFFNRATSQSGQFEMHTTALNSGLVSHAPHTHIQEEIILILRGNVEMQIGDQFYKAAAGDLVFLSSNIPHALKNTGNEQCEYFAFQWRN
jgi:(S)-ureidoglycine aminohydrolase